MYVNQSVNVRWNNEFSDKFGLSNGVKQGMILSALLYCIYMSGLFDKLKERRTGCWVNTDYLGILGYSDDNMLLSPSLEGLQEMLITCEEYAKDHNLKFSTNPVASKSKTRCIAFLKSERNLRKMKLCGNDLPWESSGKHLGNKVENKIDGMRKDLLEKRAKYIDKNNELCQEFHFAHPRSKLQMNQIFNSHFSGSSLWDLFIPEAVQLENSYNVSFRIMFDLPRETHKYLVEPVSGSIHLKKVLVKRFLSFTDSIKSSKKIALKNMFNVVKNDCQSVTGANLHRISKLVNKYKIEDLVPEDSLSISYHKIPEDEEWRVGYIVRGIKL